jgi:hypothetical protein
VAIRGPGTAGNTGWALEAHDLLISKLVAGRDKDLRFVAVALAHGLADSDTLAARLAETEVDDATRQAVAARIRACRPPSQ